MPRVKVSGSSRLRGWGFVSRPELNLAAPNPGERMRIWEGVLARGMLMGGPDAEGRT